MAAPEKKPPRVKESQSHAKFHLEKPTPQEVAEAIEIAEEFMAIIPFRVTSLTELSELLNIIRLNISIMATSLVLDNLEDQKDAKNVVVGFNENEGSYSLSINGSMNIDKPIDYFFVSATKSGVFMNWSSGTFRVARFHNKSYAMSQNQMEVTIPVFDNNEPPSSTSILPTKFKIPEMTACVADMDGSLHHFFPERSGGHDQIEGYVDLLQLGVSKLLEFMMTKDKVQPQT